MNYLSIIPVWYWQLEFLVIFVFILMLAYGVKKVLLLRIPYQLRMIDETIDEINQDKDLNGNRMFNRQEILTNYLHPYLKEIGIETYFRDGNFLD